MLFLCIFISFWCQKAAGAGSGSALCKMACMLSEGQGCRRDRPRAREIMEELAAGGDATAECLLAAMLCEEEGEDRARGEAILRRHAEAGLGAAQSCLGSHLLRMAENGGAGREEARQWLEKAAAQDVQLAADLLESAFGGGEGGDGA